LGLGKILWHKFSNEVQLSFFVEGVHIVLQVISKTVKILDIWHNGCGVNPSGFPGVVGATAEVTVVCLFLATILGSVFLDFAVEAQVAFHKFHFLGFGVLLSSASGGIDV